MSHPTPPHSTPPRRTPPTLFEDAVDVPMWLEADGSTPFAERVRRERDIVRRLPAEEPIARVRGWWRQIGGDRNAGAGERLDQLRQVVSVAMFAVGLLAGIGVALAAFHYEGTHPVNVVRLLALLLVLPTVLLILTLLLIPGRVPGLRPVQDLLASLSPGALAAALYRRLAKPPPDYARLFGWQPGRTTAGSRFAKWQLLYWSQISAVAFNLAALATGAVAIAFTDLAFGWSTTLAADPVTVSRIVNALAWPWHALAPSAVPDLELIERSQFFRLETGSGFGADAPRVLAGWWSFTILAIVTYGLLPRLALLVFANFRLRAATRALLLEDPRVTALLDRMAAPGVELGSAEPPDEQRPVPPAGIERHAELAGTAAAVVWGASLDADAARRYARDRLGLELTDVLEAGGGRELDEDRRALDAIAGSDARTLVIFTPAWEPPLLEFLDFLTALRQRVGDASIVVTPVSEDRGDVTAIERDTWAQAIGRLTDPRLYLETGAA
ncbi:MAG: DUF2868 domain-containing protein [Gammaproteobacteria bacterium]|nr:DUF2868 domain-containing protein [Gammaproteobacteria bacterium]